MISDETQIEFFADHVANATCKTRDKGHGKNPEYLVVAALRKLRTDKTCPAERS